MSDDLRYLRNSKLRERHNAHCSIGSLDAQHQPRRQAPSAAYCCRPALPGARYGLVIAYTMSPTNRLNDSFSTNCL